MANRSRDYYRKMRARAIKHKKHISAHYWHYKFDGQYSKGKVHCSCPDCSAKSSKHGFKISDIRKYMSAKGAAEELGLRLSNCRCMHTHWKV